MTIRIGDSILSTSAPIFETITNTDLSNLSEQGQAKFDAKADKSELNNKANKDLNNVVEIAEGSLVDNELKNKLNNQQITNCLLEVPQKIKLELNDGVLTLKAGSQVIVPNGAGVFDEVVITNDLSLGEIGSYTGSSFFAYKRSTNELLQAILSASRSGATDPNAGTDGFWYDTANNTVLNYYNAGTNVHHDVSLPFAIVHRTSGSWDKIEQVFNGIGYIGSTVWANKGVKGLIPDGRNEDGTLNNIEFTTQSVQTSTLTGTYSNVGIWLSGQTIGLIRFGAEAGSGTWAYDEINNYNKSLNGNIQIALAGLFNINSSAISNFRPKLPFRAVDYSDKFEISSWGMPSDKSVDLTLGASGSTYTAPANGWVLIDKKTSSGQNIVLWNLTKTYGFSVSSSATFGQSILLPVSKGDVFKVDYTATGTTNYFRFIYAEGEVS